MRVCFFAETYTPIISGTSIALQRVVKELRSRGHRVCVITAQYPGHIDIVEEGIIRYESIPLPRRFDFRLGIPLTRHLLPRIRRANPEIIHAQQPFIAGRIAQRLAMNLGIPLVGTIHTQYDHDHYLHYASFLPRRWVKHVLQVVVRRFCNACDAITTPAYGMADRLVEMGVTVPISVIPNGIDITHYRRASEKSFRADHGWSNVRLLLFVGRLTREKNLRFLLRSFVLVTQALADVQLLLVGDGPDRSHLRALAVNLGISERVHFFGWVPPIQVPSFYRGADLFVMPSVSEVNPLCLGEALASGTPVVAIDTFSARQCLHDGEDGLLTPHNQADFSAAILRLLDDPARYQQMCYCAEANAEAFALSKQVDALLAFYEQVLARAGHRASAPYVG